MARTLAEFFETCGRVLSPTLCSPPVKIGELDTMSNDLSHIGPILRATMPGTSMFNMSGQPAMSVPLAWNNAGLPLGMMFAARLGDEATLFVSRGNSSKRGRGGDKLRRYARKHALWWPKLSLIRARGRETGAATGTPIPLTEYFIPEAFSSWVAAIQPTMH